MNFISGKPISIFQKNPRAAFLIPDGNELIAIEKLIDGLEWLNTEFLKDCSSFSCDEAMRDKDFHARNVARTLGYVNQASILENLMIKTYKGFIESLNKYIDQNIIEDISKLDGQRAGFERTEKFRNKVSAHLSYVYPKKDNLSLQVTSLVSLISGAFTGDDVSTFSMGGIGTIVNGENPSEELPPINIKTTHAFLKNHYQRWKSMFEEKLIEARKKLPINDIDFEAT